MTEEKWKEKKNGRLCSDWGREGILTRGAAWGDLAGSWGLSAEATGQYGSDHSVQAGTCTDVPICANTLGKQGQRTRSQRCNRVPVHSMYYVLYIYLGTCNKQAASYIYIYK